MKEEIRRRSDKIVVVWTSKDREVAKDMVFHYLNNFQFDSHWKTVRLVLWGPSINLLALDKELQEDLEDLRKFGIELQACRSDIHTDRIFEFLKNLGFEIVSIDNPINEYRKAKWSIAIF